MSCEDEHHNHGNGSGNGHGSGHDHLHVAPIQTNESQSLLSKIDLPHTTALNLANPPDDLQKIFRSQEDKYKLKPIIKTDCDPQIIINIPFLNGSVKLFSLILRTNGDKYCPKTIKVWKNDRTIDFDNANSKKPTYTITHPQVGVMLNDDEDVPDMLEDDGDFVEHYLPRHVFTGVQQLTLFIDDIYDDEEDESHLHYIELRGEFTELTKDPVITLYELAANPTDHKNLTATEATNYSLVRHGQSTWNEKNLFTGWVDCPLSTVGEKEAARAGELLKEANLKGDILYTSKLSRAIQTANIALNTAGQLYLPVKRSWRLNERHYGALQGKDKAATLEQYGQEKFQTWRRSFDVPPPVIADDSEFSQAGDERYKDVDPSVLPKTESLKLVIDRLLPYWQDEISKDLLEGKTVIVAAHGNSLRALVKHLDNISDEDIAGLNIPTGIPLVYELDEKLHPTKPAYYLDPEAAAAGAAAVAAQGSKK